MDLSNIKGLLETNESLDLDDNDLEDELNAIISGRAVSARPKQITSSSVNPNVKRIKQNDSKQSKTQNISKTQPKVSDNKNDFIVSNDLLNIEKLGIIGDFDEDIDDEDIDEDNEDLLSEINSIVSNKSSANRPRSGDKIPEIDYEIPSLNTNRTQNINISEVKTTNSDQNLKQIYSNKVVDNLAQFDPIYTKPVIPTNSSEISVLNRNKSTQSVGPVKSEPIGSNENIKKENKITDNKSDICRLNALKDDYKRAALNAKKCGQQTNALSHIKTAKQIEVLIQALENGQPVDLSQLPPPPIINPNISENTVKSMPQMDSNQEIGFEIDVQNIELTTEDAKKFFNAPPPPNTIMEALEQRLAKFKSTLEAAKEENNSSKVRRLGRIVKQYETAIKDFGRGKTLDFEELPTPPGFGPIPVVNDSKKVDNNSDVTKNEVKMTPKPQLPVKPIENRAPIASNSPQSSRPKVVAQSEPKVAQRPILKRASSTANKQLNYLLERQRLFKEAALESKQKGDIQQAKEYLRMAKGFEPLIEATQNGLPIDATSIPTPPQMNDDFVMVSQLEASEDVNDLEKEEMYRKIEVELQNQIEMCKRNKEYFLQLGDVSTASKFEKYAVDSRKDLDWLTVRWRTGQKVPNFKYETRTFSIVVCNTEVSTNEVSVEVLKALDIPGKADIDTYVKIEFPFPNDHNQTGRTKIIKNNINPAFNEIFKFEIDRKSRQLPRIFKRHPLKLELMSKGGFLRSDTLIGTVLIKLVDFETKCTIHDSFPLTEGRKTIGGKIEVKVRIREPLLAKQVEEVKEKWLTFV